jgi:hypothetical protein
MLGGCLSSAMYPLEADLYTKKRTVNPNTGQSVYTWQLWKTIRCAISPFVSTSFKTQPTNESFREEYDKITYLKLKTPANMNVGRNAQVTNIRNANTQEVLYREVEIAGSPATIFNTQGSSPQLNPFGEIIQYDTLIIRASDQSDVTV